ncbi:hypothetical protein QR685DRAFT_534237 [Neurospora intermedia]|uniref:Secreted protein n=1 Tax=Neurospora intermedia TaxID=5142 RepID=A0ABR3D533_NEUIN
MYGYNVVWFSGWVLMSAHFFFSILFFSSHRCHIALFEPLRGVQGRETRIASEAKADVCSGFCAWDPHSRFTQYTLLVSFSFMLSKWDSQRGGNLRRSLCKP